MTIIIFILILALLVLAHEFGHFICARKSGMRVYEFGFGFPPRVFGIQRLTRMITKEIAEQEEVTVDIEQVARTEDMVVVEEKVTDKIREVDVVSIEKKWRLIWRKENDEDESAQDGWQKSTIYSINWLPLGGFCKIKGENGEEAQEPDSFGFHKAWKRAIVLAAGVTMNVVLATVLLSIGFMIGLPTDLSAGVDSKAIVVDGAKVKVQQIEKDSPADKGGIKFGDQIVSINNIEIKNSEQMVGYVREHSAEKLAVMIERGRETKTLELTPVLIKAGEEAPRLGVTLADVGIIRYPWYLAIYKGIIAAGVGFINIFIAFYLLIKNLLVGQGLAFQVSGPVGIAVLVGDSVRLGFNYLINLTAMLSLTLAAINILPIPALDGGRILFILIEKIFRKPVPMKYEQLAHTIGFVLLMGLIIIVTFRDVKGLF